MTFEDVVVTVLAGYENKRRQVNPTEVDDIGESRDIAILDNHSMRELDLQDGNIILLQGKRHTRARVRGSPPISPIPKEDELDNFSIRIDALTRNNIGVDIGDHIRIIKDKETPVTAKEVTLRLLGYDDDPIEIIKKITDQDLALNLDQVPIMLFDNVMVLFRGVRLFLA